MGEVERRLRSLILGASLGLGLVAFASGGALAGAAGLAVAVADRGGALPHVVAASPLGAVLGAACVVWLFTDALGGPRAAALGRVGGVLALAFMSGLGAEVWSRLFSLWRTGPAGVEAAIATVTAAALAGAGLLAPALGPEGPP